MTLSLPNGLRFQTFKYVVYLMLFINTAFFLYEDWAASLYTFSGGLSLATAIEAFATFIDSISWLLLLGVFELQTALVPHARQTLKFRLCCNAIVAVCYMFILLALGGYWAQASSLYDFQSVAAETACALVGDIQAFAVQLDHYAPLNTETCPQGPKAPLFVNQALSITSDAAVLSDMQRLAATDVVNAGSWLCIVLILWFDIWLQLKGALSDQALRLSGMVKGTLYTLLVVCALYWLGFGAWIDAWDAFLWILAFFAIELNLFKWHDTAEAPKTA